MLNNTLSPSSFRSKLEDTVKSMQTKFSGIKLVLCSIIPDSSSEMIDGATMLKYIIQEVVDRNGPNADVAFLYMDAHTSREGVHPKKPFIGRTAKTINC